jgi:uncharacterized protein (TIGR02611 family)
MDLREPERQRVAQTLTFLTLLRRIVVGLSGGLVLIVGVAMTILPGPAIVVVPLGLTILATEFAWARRVMHRFRHVSERMVARMRRQQLRTERASNAQRVG